MSLASCVLCAQLYLCAPARHLPPVCVSVSSADVFVCQCLGVSELFSVCSQACLPRSHVCLGVPCPRGCGH